MHKKILYFFPLNPLHSNAGSMTRVMGLLSYFQTKDFVVDFINSNDEWGGRLSPDDIIQLKNHFSVRTVYGLSRNAPKRQVFPYLRYLLSSIFLRKLLKYGTDTLTDYANFYRQKQFNAILAKDEYDYIIISYAYWANLLKNNKKIKGAKLIIDTHDWLTAQDKDRKRFKIGKGFAEEIKRLNLFDQIWTLSSDEQYIFSQFCQKRVELVPIGFKSPMSTGGEISVYDRRFDIIYVAGDNMHNIKACRWFFDHVYHLLPKELSLCVIGKINAHVPDHGNITKIPFADDLNIYYQQSKIAICPMLSGTGVKIKVVEALSHGLPVVCNSRGTDGLLNKVENGCVIEDSPQGFASAILMLLDQPEFYHNISQQGLTYFDHHHSLTAFTKKMDKLFDLC